MESAAIYTTAARYRARALTILTVSDHIKRGEAMESSRREKGFGDMVQIGLDTAIAFA
jgi:purine-nucleoside phosphorylase